VPLIQELTNKLAEAKTQAAQIMAGVGMQQPPQGGSPIAQQVMQQAAQESQGVTSLQSNLPQEYAGGGIIAFEDGGQVERYQNTGLVSGTPAGRFFSGLGQNFTEANEMAKLRNKLQMQYGPASAVPGLFMNQTDEERLAAKAVAAALPNLSFPQLQQLAAEGPSALAGFSKPAPSATPAAATPSAAPGGPSVQTQPPPAPPPAPNFGIGGGGFKAPVMQTYTPTIAAMPERTMGDLTDLNAITQNLSADKKKAVDDTTKEAQKIYEGFDEPGNAAREEKYSKREADLEKDSAISRALNVMNLGFGVAGSKERTLAGALGNEGRQGIRDLIQGEAASRAAKNRLDDARDNFEQQKVAAKKGNYQAAQAAGKDAGKDVQDATQMALTAAHFGNSQGIQMYSALQQGDIGRATVGNQGEQLKLSAVDSANKNTLGIAGLGLTAQQLAQQGSIAKAQLIAQNERYAAMDKASQARIMQATAKGLNDFMQNEGAQLRAQLAKDYGPNFMTAQDARSLEAQQMFNQRKQAYLADIRGQAIDALSARSSSDL